MSTIPLRAGRKSGVRNGLILLNSAGSDALGRVNAEMLGVMEQSWWVFEENLSLGKREDSLGLG